MIKSWINSRMKERTSWDGAALVVLGLMVLFLAPLAKIAEGLAVAYGAWTIWKSELLQFTDWRSTRSRHIPNLFLFYAFLLGKFLTIAGLTYVKVVIA